MVRCWSTIFEFFSSKEAASWSSTLIVGPLRASLWPREAHEMLSFIQNRFLFLKRNRCILSSADDAGKYFISLIDMLPAIYICKM
jgi:hypothetical protein